jgi:hypothetical protein
MKLILSLAVLAPTAALAHPGDHGGFSVQGVLAHIARAPDHAAMIVAVVVAGLVLLYRTRARK